MIKQTNKQLLGMGLQQEDLLKLIEEGLQVMNQEDISVNNIEWEGDDFSTSLRFADHKARNWVVYYLDDENTDTLYANTYKGEELEEKNEKSFKSVKSVMNHIIRVVGN